jgi:Spondin_N
MKYAGLCILPCVALAAAAGAEPAARYEVRFERTWSSETHPKDFPLLAHFSPVIGVTHGAGFSLFRQGAAPTPGLEKLCEEGKHQPLDAELKGAIGNGGAGALIETKEPLRSVPGVATAVFEVDAAHPFVDIAAMIAPSPDWCAVAADVDLREGDGWVSEKTVVLYPWDMGTDSATSYRAFDDDQQPRGTLQPSDSPYFVAAGQPTPVGSVRFVKQ